MRPLMLFPLLFGGQCCPRLSAVYVLSADAMVGCVVVAAMKCRREDGEILVDVGSVLNHCVEPVYVEDRTEDDEGGALAL